MSQKRDAVSSTAKTRKRPGARGGGPAAVARKAPSPRSARRGGEPEAGALAQLDRLIAMMIEKEVVEVEYEQAGTRWRVRRAEQHPVTYAPAAPLPLAMAAPAPGGPAESKPQGEVFKSPMVGTFYRAPSPEAEPFFKPGDKVAADKTICIIEAMKVMNEIKAEREFEILEALVKNGESVEYGQPLFTIR
jgi:acetyl-CoA carboxylase biotin carboxyl carrier protein